jgi:cephalosporin hydroxylase
MDLAKLCNECWTAGQDIDLSNIQRNPAVNKGVVDYYFFLAGFVRFNRISTIVEVGTHYGGSALAMLAGGGEQLDRIITVDVSNASDPYLKGKDKIIKVVGDGSQQATAAAVLQKIGAGGRADLLYIDTLHTYKCTSDTFHAFYPSLRPKWVIFDDITLNDEMAAAWKEVTSKFGPDDSINVASAVPAARKGRAGFGLIRADR